MQTDATKKSGLGYREESNNPLDQSDSIIRGKNGGL